MALFAVSFTLRLWRGALKEGDLERSVLQYVLTLLGGYSSFKMCYFAGKCLTSLSALFLCTFWYLLNLLSALRFASSHENSCRYSLHIALFLRDQVIAGSFYFLVTFFNNWFHLQGLRVFVVHSYKFGLILSAGITTRSTGTILRVIFFPNIIPLFICVLFNTFFFRYTSASKCFCQHLVVNYPKFCLKNTTYFGSCFHFRSPVFDS